MRLFDKYFRWVGYGNGRSVESGVGSVIIHHFRRGRPAREIEGGEGGVKCQQHQRWLLVSWKSCCVALSFR